MLWSLNGCGSGSSRKQLVYSIMSHIIYFQYYITYYSEYSLADINIILYIREPVKNVLADFAR